MRSGALWAFGSDLNPYPPLEGEGRLTLSQRVGAKRRPMINSAKCETGWGDLSAQALFERRDCHPTPPLISFVSTLPSWGGCASTTTSLRFVELICASG